jgi:uncharacterized membrane protein HdeD (DUF308 family)
MFLLALVHAFVPFYDIRFNVNTLWLMEFGIPIVIAGLLNLISLLKKDTKAQATSLAVNILMTLVFTLILFDAPQQQIYLGSVFFGLASITTFFKYMNSSDYSNGET